MNGKTRDLSHDLKFSAHTINYVCHSIRLMFRVLRYLVYITLPTVLLQALDEDERAEWVTELEKCRDFSDSGNGIEVEDLEMEDIGDYVRVSSHVFTNSGFSICNCFFENGILLLKLF